MENTLPTSQQQLENVSTTQEMDTNSVYLRKILTDEEDSIKSYQKMLQRQATSFNSDDTALHTQKLPKVNFNSDQQSGLKESKVRKTKRSDIQQPREVTSKTIYLPAYLSPVQCNICLELFTSRSIFRHHFYEFHSIYENKPYKLYMSYTCSKCKKSFSEYAMIEKHSCIQYTTVTRFGRQQQRMIHRNTNKHVSKCNVHYDEPRGFKCEICSLTFMSRGIFNLHYEKSHCTNGATNMEQQIPTHSAETLAVPEYPEAAMELSSDVPVEGYHCSFCSEIFLSFSCREYHTKEFHSEELFNIHHT